MIKNNPLRSPQKSSEKLPKKLPKKSPQKLPKKSPKILCKIFQKNCRMILKNVDKFSVSSQKNQNFMTAFLTNSWSNLKYYR